MMEVVFQVPLKRIRKEYAGILVLNVKTRFFIALYPSPDPLTDLYPCGFEKSGAVNCWVFLE